MTKAYYNEFDPAAAHILRQQIVNGVIAPGDVDTRSIKEVSPDDLRGYDQHHFFAGGGLWSVAARLAGWPDDAPLWTGSCPCQPFSAAGKGLGTDDPRHLWPDFHRLVRACRPAVVMGEQVAGAAGYGWFDGVRADLEGEGYAGRAVDFPACSVDAPHQRNRLYWIAVDVADSSSARLALGSVANDQRRIVRDEGPSVVADHARGRGDVADGASQGRDARPFAGIHRETQGERPRHGELERPSGVDGDRVHADADRGGRAGWQEGPERQAIGRTASERHLLRNGTYWSDAEWLVCHDGKARRAQSGIRFLVDGLPGRVDLWRVGGNAIVPEAAAEVIASFIDAYGIPRAQSVRFVERVRLTEGVFA